MPKTTHGHTTGLQDSATYTSWRAMIRRCTDQTRHNWERYGGRGIRVCARWQAFESFLADMGERPVGTVIDRINNDGDYEFGNCRWVTVKESIRNRRCTRYLTHAGETLTLVGWAERLQVSPGVLAGRLRAGWDVDTALTIPAPQRNRNSGQMCSVSGCTRPSRRRAMCGTHYAQLWRHGDIPGVKQRMAL